MKETNEMFRCNLPTANIFSEKNLKVILLFGCQQLKVTLFLCHLLIKNLRIIYQLTYQIILIYEVYMFWGFIYRQFYENFIYYLYLATTI